MLDKKINKLLNRIKNIEYDENVEVRISDKTGKYVYFAPFVKYTVRLGEFFFEIHKSIIIGLLSRKIRVFSSLHIKNNIRPLSIKLKIKEYFKLHKKVKTEYKKRKVEDLNRELDSLFDHTYKDMSNEIKESNRQTTIKTEI